MGMDIFGIASTDKQGEYFRNNYWYWRPLARYCQQIAPELCLKVEWWETNDSDGLKTQEDCDQLAKALEIAAANETPWTLRREELDPEMYPFTFDNVREFAVFLRKCGGFEIR